MNKTTLFVVLAIVIGTIIILTLDTSGNSDSITSNAATGISLSTSPNPLRPGMATFIFNVKDKNGKPVNDAKVSFDLNMTTMNMGIQQGDARSLGDGRYSAQGRMTMSGPWRISSKVIMPNGAVENEDFTVDVQ